jgi:hypothetical protein
MAMVAHAMIRPLRRIHRFIFTLLFILLPLLLGAALLARPAVIATSQPADKVWSIRIEGPHLVVERPASTPEVLAYLEADAAATLPGPGSHFLGALTGPRTTFDMPADAMGQVLLYSPALQRTLARQSLP